MDKFMTELSRAFDVLDGPSGGRALRVRHRASGAEYALKRPREGPGLSPGERGRLQTRLRRWMSLDSPNVICCRGTVDIAGELCALTEWAGGGDLETFAARSGPVELELCLDILTKAASGLACIHESGLLHLDVKPSNILICGPRQVKIGDLDGALTAEEGRAGGFSPCTRQFRAPEQTGLPLGRYTDIYSWALTALYLLHGRALWLDGAPASKMAENYTLPLPIPPELKTLLLHCLSPAPEKRPQYFTPVLSTLSSIRAKKITD